MRTRFVGQVILAAAVLAFPGRAWAQEAVVLGTVTDSTGGVLPGVAVTAVHEATGNVFETVTDGTGAFRLPVRIGTYRLSAALPGFSTVNRTGLQLLVGQQATVDVQLVPASLQESVTVTGEAPLIETTSSTLGTSIDSRQMEELPLNGRNWMDLAMLAAGSRQNQSSGAPLMRQGYSQINVDGQQVTNIAIGLGDDQPKYSRDSIAEFEVITNRFDATQGRSAGMIVNAITKSGTNSLSGSMAAYFRDDRFSAKDFIQNRVIPYSNQQLSGTLGGPIRRDRVHYFGSYEYEREPQTITFDSPFPAFNIDQPNTRREHKMLGRVDMQFSPATRVGSRFQRYHQTYFSGGGASNHPSVSQTQKRYSTQALGTLTQVISPTFLNEIKGGFAYFDRDNDPFVTWAGGDFPIGGSPVASRFLRRGSAIGIQLRGYNIATSSPQHIWQDTYSLRDDITWSFALRGRHDIRMGGEYAYNIVRLQSCAACGGRLDARNGNVPANIAQLFPVWDDASTWNYAPLSPISRRVTINVSDNNFLRRVNQQLMAGWLQDDWRLGSRLTVNLGARYDLSTGVHSEKVELLPWLPGDLPYDTNNIAPRLGFAYTVNDRTVIRGGYGMFYAQVSGDEAQQTLLYIVGAIAETPYDGRADFASNPFNGPRPSFGEVASRRCGVDARPGCVRVELTQEMNHPWKADSYSHQASLGVQRQVGTLTSVEANYVYTAGRLEENTINANLSYNPATAANYPFSDVTRRPFPTFGAVHFGLLEGWSNYHGLELSLTKRMSNRWQAGATYTLSGFWDGEPQPWQFFLGGNGIIDRQPLGFEAAPDLGGEYTLAASDQRHRAVFNGIVEIAYGFQLSGLYFFGSGERRGASTGADLRDVVVGGSDRLRANGTIVPRNTLVGSPLHRVDLRLQRRFSLGGRRTADAMAEVFNIFNHENFGSYVTNESNANYGRPTFNSNIAYQPRSMQFGVRFGF